MNEKPEALRLVDVPFALRDGLWHTQADHVLQNLHVDSEQLRAQRDALLEALELLISYTESCEGLLNASPAGQVLKARAAIKAVEGEKE